MALIYLNDIGYVDDGGGGGQEDTSSSSQSPYAWNQQDTQPQQSPYQYNEQPSNLSVPDQWSQDNYTYGQQSQQQSPWDFGSWFNQQPKQPEYDYSGYADSTPPNLYLPDQQSNWNQDDYTYGQQNQKAPAAPDPLGFNNPPLFMGTSANTKLTPPGPTYSDNPETPFNFSDYSQPQPKPYKPYWEQEINKPPLPYQEGYDPQVGSQLDPSKIMDRASPETLKNLDFFNQALTGFGGAIAPIGKAVDFLANGTTNNDLYQIANSQNFDGVNTPGSYIPPLGNVAATIRNAWEQVVEPLGNIGSAEVGDMSVGRGGPYAAFTNSLGLKGQTATQKIGDAVSSLWDPQKAQQLEAWRNQQVQQEVANQIAGGASPEEAAQKGERLRSKLNNPLNYAEYQGMQDFSKLPAPVQLLTMAADPLGNLIYGGALKPFTHGLPTLAGKAAEASGLSDVGRAIDEKLFAGPKKNDYKAGLGAENVFGRLNDIADEFQIPAPDLTRTFLKDTTSPLYYGNLDVIANDPRKLAVAQKWEQLYDASSTPDLTNSKPVLEGGKVLPQTENQLGVMAQDTSGAVDPNASQAKPIERPPAEAGTVSPGQPALDAQSQADFNALGSVNPAPVKVEAAKLPDNYAGIKLPDKEAAGLDEWFGAVRTAQGVDTGALKLDKTLAKPGYRDAKPLEEWGPLGKALRGANAFTQATVARPFLNTFSRGAIRDPLSNEGKLLVTRPELIAEQVKSIFGKSQVNAQAEKLYGKGLTLGPSSITEGSGAKAGKSNPLAELYYVAANPLNELSAKGLKLATGGKFQDWSVYSERREANVKELLFNKLRLEVGDRLTKEAVDNQFFKDNPALYKQFSEGKINTADLEKALSGKHFDGFDLNDARNKTYNPSNTSKEFDEKYDKVLSGQAGIYGNIVYQAASSVVDRVKIENQRKVVEYLQKAGYRVPKDGDLSKIKPSVLRDAKANAKLIKLSEVVPGHPIYEQMLNEATDALDAARLSMFPNDPALFNASYFLANAALNHAADSGRYELFSRGLKDYTAAKEAGYAIKFKAPPTDFEKMMSIRDKYEALAHLNPQEIRKLPASQKLTPKEIADYEAWRDNQPIRNMASESGVELPESESLFNGAKTLEDYQKTLRQSESFKSREYDEFGGTPLTVTHQKQLAQILFDKDYPAFQKFVSDIRANSRYREGVTGEGRGKGTGVYVDRTGANADRTVNRLQQYWKDANAVDTGSPGLPEATQAQPKPKAESVVQPVKSVAELPKPATKVEQPAKFAPAPVPQVTKKTGNPVVDYYKRKPVELNLHDLLMKEGKRPREMKAVMDRPLKDRTDTAAYMQDLFNAARKDGLSEDGIWKASGQPRTQQLPIAQQPLPQPVAQPTKPVATPKVAAPVVEKPRPVEATQTPEAQNYAPLVDVVNNPPPVRLNVGKQNGRAVNGAVLTPDAMRKIASNFTRKERVNSKGDTYVAPVTRVQMNKYLHDFQATDQYYRKVTYNQFKLDPDYLVPVRIADGKTLNEIMGQPLPPRIGPEVPPMKGIPFEYLGEYLKTRYGEDVYKQDFSKMDPALRDTIIRDIGLEYFGVDPLNPIVNPKGNAEHRGAIEMLADLTDDAQKRFDEAKATKEDLTSRQSAYDLDMKSTVETLAAERARIALQVNDEAYKGTKGTFFDYRDKNRLDQALGSILPFQYWARQNFAYLARHFAANPYHFAAVLNFYQEMEKENSDPTIPGYQKSSIFIMKMPGGENLTIKPSSYLPINPMGDDSMFGGLSLMTDDELVASNTKLANTKPLSVFNNPGEFLFGKDIKNAQGKVVGRDKGLVPSWMSPNPYIKDALMQTGVANKWWQNLAGKDQTTLGQDYPEETRGQHARVSWFPAADLYASTAASTPVGGALRNAGITKGEFNPVGPINEMLYGKNAGKPQTAIYQEINRMTANGEITAEEGKLAIAAYKDGSYKSVPLLAAIDRAYADNFAMKVASQVGFSGLLSNTPRQQVTNKLYDEQTKAYDKLPTGYSLDDKGNAVANKSAVSKFYSDNPAASVLSTEQSNDTPETIRSGIADDKTYKDIAALKAQRKDGTLDYPAYAAELNKLQGENPTFFKKNPYYTVTPGEAKYENLADQYKAIGGQNFDDLQTKAFALKDKGDEDGYKKIVSSSAYKTASNQRLDFLLANPDFQKQYTSNNDQYARERTQELVGGVGRSNPQLAPKPQRTLEDLQYTKTTNQYYDMGGDKFDKLQTQAYAAKDKGDDATYKKIVSSPEYQQAQDKRNEFIFDNPDWYKTYSDNSVAHGGTNKNQGPLPPTADKAIPRLTPKPPRSIDDIKYAQTESEYYAKGGDQFDQMQADIKKYFDAGQDNKAYDIINSRDYQRVQSTLDQFKLDDPEFEKRYNSEYQAKYGKPPKSEVEKVYDEQRAAYYKIGGADFDQTQKKIDDLFKAGKDAEAYTLMNDRDYKRITASQDQFKLDNPDFARKYNADNFAKYGTTPKSDADKLYSEQKGQLANIGGSKYDGLSALVSEYMDKGDKKSAGVILGSEEYKRAKAARDQYLLDNPEFAARYKAENEAKYGPAKTSTTSSSSNSSSGYKSTGGSNYSYTPKKATTSYKPQAKSSTSYAPYNAAQKVAYAKALATGKGTAYAQAAAKNALNQPTTTAAKKTVVSSTTTPGYVPAAFRQKAPKDAVSVGGKTLSDKGWESVSKPSDFDGPQGKYAWDTKAEAQAAADKMGESENGEVVRIVIWQPELEGYQVWSKLVSELTDQDMQLVNKSKQIVDSTKSSTYNKSATTIKSVSGLPKPFTISRGGGGGGGSSRKAPSVPFHNFLPGPNTSLVKFSKRKRYK